MEDDFAVHGGGENGALVLQFLAQLGGVGQVAVVGNGDLAAFAVAGQRLGVAQVGGAGGGIAGVADGEAAGQIMEDVAGKNCETSPMRLYSRNWPLSQETMPALSWPRCCKA